MVSPLVKFGFQGGVGSTDDGYSAILFLLELAAKANCKRKCYKKESIEREE